MASLTTNNNTSRLVRHMLGEQFQKELINARGREDLVQLKQMALGEMSHSDIAHVNRRRSNDFIRGVRASLFGGTFGKPEDFVHNIGEDFWNDLAYSAGHFTGFVSDMAILDLLFKEHWLYRQEY